MLPEWIWNKESLTASRHGWWMILIETLIDGLECKTVTYFCVNASAGQFVLQNHDDDSEHSDDKCIVADPFALLEKSFPATKPVANVGFLFPTGRDGACGASRCVGADATAEAPTTSANTAAADTWDNASNTGADDGGDATRADFVLVFGVPRVFGMNAHQGRGGFFDTAVIFATGSFHGRWDGQCWDWFPQLFGKRWSWLVSIWLSFRFKFKWENW